MIDLIVIALQNAFILYGDFDEDDFELDGLNYAYHCGEAAGIAAAAGLFGVKALEMCDDISDAYEDADLNFMRYILNEASERPDSNNEHYARTRDPEIFALEYGAALAEALRAKEEGDLERYSLMIGLTVGLMFRHQDHDESGPGEVRAKIITGYETDADELLQQAHGTLGFAARMTDPMGFIGQEAAARHYEEHVRTMRWIQNFGLREARSKNETAAIPNSMSINYQLTQQSDDQEMENPPRPIDHCYWVVPGKLLAGEYPRNIDEPSSREKLCQLTDAGVSAFIDLTDPSTTDHHLKPYAHLLNGQSHQRFAIRDLSVPSSPELTKAALDAIDAHIAAGETVYVHCWGGVGRTGTIIGCWLSRHHEPGQAALARLQELWQENPKSRTRRSPETGEQVQYVLDWNETDA